MKPTCLLILALAATPLAAHEPAESTDAKAATGMPEMCASMHAMMKDMSPEQMKAHMQMMQKDGKMPMEGCGMNKAGGENQHTAVGTVTAVDTAAGKVTVAHEPVASLKWPAMTMGFEVEDKQVLHSLETGEKVRFSFTEQDGRYLITSIDES